MFTGGILQCFWKSCSFHRFRHRHPTFVSHILVFAFKIIPQRPHFPTCEQNPTEIWSFLLWKSVHKVFIIYKLNETNKQKIQMFSLQQCLLQIYGKVHTFTYSMLALWHFYKLWPIAEINHRRIPCPTQLIISLEIVGTGIIFPSCTCSSCILLLF